MRNILILTAISFLLQSCIQTSSQNEDDLPRTEAGFIDCSEEPLDGYVVTTYETGVERDTPINLVSREVFIERLRTSPLWDIINYQFAENEDYPYTLGFNDTDNMMYIYGSEYITEISYGLTYLSEPYKGGHTLSEQDKAEMIETINLVIDDREKATEILNQLYDQYLKEVETLGAPSDEHIVHTYVQYNDIYFEFWGTHGTNHPIDQCNLSRFENLLIR